MLVEIGSSYGTGSSPMELEFPVQVNSGISTEPEVIWWYVCTAEEVERKGSTAVRYLILLVLSRPYTLECTQQALVSGEYCSAHAAMLMLYRRVMYSSKISPRINHRDEI